MIQDYYHYRRAHRHPFRWNCAGLFWPAALGQKLIQIELRSKMTKASFERAMFTVKASFIREI
jgi:hypothetical protein